MRTAIFFGGCNTLSCSTLDLLGGASSILVGRKKMISGSFCSLRGRSLGLLQVQQQVLLVVEPGLTFEPG